MKFIYFMLPLFMLFLSCGSPSDDGDDSSPDLGIRIEDGSRVYSFTNKHFAQYSGETNRSFTNGWQGLIVREKLIFNDYELSINDRLLDRAKAEVTVYPSHLKRVYDDNTTELFFLPDSLEFAAVRLTAQKGDTLHIVLKGYKGSGKPVIVDSYLASVLGGVQPGKNFFAAAWGNLYSAEKKGDDLYMSVELDRDTTNIIFLIDENPEGIWYLTEHGHDYLTLKQSRIDSLLGTITVSTNDKEFDKAYLWAAASLDALITEQQTKGIFAGLPWFNNFWGRDTFISLPGAALVLGRFETARNILSSFAQYQDTIPSSRFYGRIPNRITLNESIYNTTDGTPRFIKQLHRYYEYTGDTEFIEEMYPVVKHAFLGALQRYIDSNGFLTHGDAETWMDAVGPEGPWSARGNRANDIQALWLGQLKATGEFAALMQDSVIHNRAVELAASVQENFRQLFVDSTAALIYDHLNPDGTPDSSLRPNLFFALTTPGLVPDYRHRLEILARAMKELVLPYGVLSLSQYDSNFHPYHEYPPYYVKDEAYHNGIIWTWNTGIVVDALTGYYLSDTAWVLTQSLTERILHKGAVGTLAELIEAFPRDGMDEILPSGTFSQAWSLAEYIRSIYENYFGVVPDAPNNALYLVPALPKALRDVEFTQYIGGNEVHIRYQFNNDIYRTTIKGNKITDSLVLGIALMNRRNANYQLKTSIVEGDELVAEIPAYGESVSNLQVLKNNVKIEVVSDLYIDPDENLELYRSIRFAEPYLSPDLQALKPPGYRMLTNLQIKEQNPEAVEIFSRNDKPKDEIYEYPLHPNFREGILDIEHFSLSEDADNYYFLLRYRNLHNPGWHNEYGYQLTLTSILIAADSTGLTRRKAGANAKYELKRKRAFNHEIIVGGGVEIRNAEGERIAAYIPRIEDVKNPLGDTKEKTVAFALPKSLIGGIDEQTVITILVGAQDDRGGAGIGEFREVLPEAVEWMGGGKPNQDAHNVYDIFTIN